jgi:hypothetical protein
MKREYKVFRYTISNQLERELNQLAESGYKIVSTSVYRDVCNEHVMIVVAETSSAGILRR